MMKKAIDRYIAGYQPYGKLKEIQDAIASHLRERDRVDAMFADTIGDRSKQYFIIATELRAIGVAIGASKDRVDIKQWRLEWQGDRTAALYWASGGGWSISTAKGGELSGVWEGFDLMEHLDANGIDTEGW